MTVNIALNTERGCIRIIEQTLLEEIEFQAVLSRAQAPEYPIVGWKRLCVYHCQVLALLIINSGMSRKIGCLREGLQNTFVG